MEDFALFMLGPDGRIVSWNAGAERITDEMRDALRPRVEPRSACISR